MILSEPTQFNPRRIPFLGSFWYQTIFAQRGSMAAYGQSDVEFFDDSYDIKHVFGSHWVQKFCTKNLEKVEKIKNIQEYSENFQHFS